MLYTYRHIYFCTSVKSSWPQYSICHRRVFCFEVSLVDGAGYGDGEHHCLHHYLLICHHSPQRWCVFLFCKQPWTTCPLPAGFVAHPCIFQGKTIKAEFSRVAKEKSISKLYFSKYLIYIMKTVKILLDPAIRTNRFAFWDIFKLILSTSCSLISNMYWWLNHFEVIEQSIIDSRYTHNSGQMEKLGYSEWNKWD